MEDFKQSILNLRAVTNRISFTPGATDPLVRTKVGGQPWWPKQLERPTCGEGHAMSFMAQIRCGDIPGFDGGPGSLLSFHYCCECSRSGDMSWGWDNATGIHGYDVRIFTEPESVEPDGVGLVAEDVLGPHEASLVHVQEVPHYSDLPENLKRTAPLDYSKSYAGFTHVDSSKLGGHPTWVQDPKWPTSSAERMKFAGQLDWNIGRSSQWAAGGYAYLFYAEHRDGDYEAELAILTT